MKTMCVKCLKLFGYPEQFRNHTCDPSDVAEAQQEEVKRVAIYPGSFNPWTKGHQDILDRALMLFDKIIIVVAVNPTKNIDASLILKSLNPIAAKNIGQVEIMSFTGLVATLGYTIIRGVRSGDWEYEQNLAMWNKELGVETIFMCPDPKYSHINSSALRTLYEAGEHIDIYAGDLDSIQIWKEVQCITK